MIDVQQQTWNAESQPRLAEIERLLRQEDYCHEARDRLAQIDEDLKAIGYDAAAHDALRREEADRRAAEGELVSLEKSRAAIAPLEREIGDLGAQITSLGQELHKQQAGYQEAAASLAEAEARAPDLQSAEREMLLLQEQENQLRMEVGAAQQKVLVLDDLKARHKTLEARREELRQELRQ